MPSTEHARNQADRRALLKHWFLYHAGQAASTNKEEKHAASTGLKNNSWYEWNRRSLTMQNMGLYKLNMVSTLLKTSATRCTAQ